MESKLAVLCAPRLSEIASCSERADVWLLCTAICQPTRQQWEGVELLHFHSTSCFSALDEELGRRLCQCSKEDEAGWLADSQACTLNTGVETKQQDREWGGAWLSFVSQAHNSLPCKRWRKAVYRHTAALRRHNQSWNRHLVATRPAQI